MFWIYVASLIFGGAFVVPMLLGGLDLDSDVDIDIDADLDVDIDVDVETDLDSGDTSLVPTTGVVADWVSSLLSFRTLVLFLAFFGLSGVGLTWLDYSEPLPFVAALPIGLVAGVVNARLLSYVKRTETSSQMTNREMEGSMAKVVVPLGTDRRGRIAIDMGGQPTYMVALPYKTGEEVVPQGAEVVVIEVKDGTAYVALLPSLEEGE